MSANRIDELIPCYHGSKWVEPELPRESRPWGEAGPGSLCKDRSDHVALSESMRLALSRAPLKWPKRPVYFITDPHADTDAFIASLVASGGIERVGPGPRDFLLTKVGGEGHFIIGGDCMDKGPSNLQMLDTLRVLMDSGAAVTLLAGNHDLRLLLGLRVLDGGHDPRTEHFFVRMGPKVVPLLKEIHDAYLQGKHSLRGIPGEKQCRGLIYPSKRWFKVFPELARWVMNDESVERELSRMRVKLKAFAESCADAGLSMRRVYAAALKCRELFVDAGGEYRWFFDRMKLVHREGSFLFVHAGVDDRVISRLAEHGAGPLNRHFRWQLREDPFEFYYGPLANCLRTKYRPVDMPLTHYGVERLHRMGIHAVVHGHRNRTRGQHIILRHGMLHVECDITMDRNSRRPEGLAGYGIGATILHPEGALVGISGDYPYAKVFQPQVFLKALSG